MTRVILIGERGDWTLGGSIRRAFADIGWTVTTVQWGPWSPRWLSSAAFRAPSLAAPFRRSLLSSVAGACEDAVDLVLVMKGPLLTRSCIEKVRELAAAPVVCWNADSPFDAAVSNSGGGIAAVVSAYDAYVTWSSSVADRIAEHQPEVIVVPFGVDPHIHHPESGGGRFRDRLVFIGTYTPRRARVLERLSRWEPVVFGNDWPNVSGVEFQPAVAGSAFRRVVGEASWNLNLLRPQNHDSHNMRTFEIPGCGGRQLAPRTPDHEHFLSGTSAVLFDTEDDLETLPLDEHPPGSFIDSTWREQHAYVRRVEGLLEVLSLGNS